MMSEVFILFFTVVAILSAVAVFVAVTALAIIHVGWWIGAIILVVFTFVVCWWVVHYI